MIVAAMLAMLGAVGLGPAGGEEGPREPAARVDEAAPVSEAAPVAEAPVQPPRFVEPRRIPARDRRPRGRTTTRFTRRPPLVRPALRVAPGFSARLNGRPPAAFGLDVLASVMLGLHGGYRQWGLAPEVGYSLRVPRVDHRLLLGLGLINGINAEIWSVGWLPRAVLVSRDDALSLGIRNGLWFDFAENGFSIELSHQWLEGRDAGVHELQVTLGIDLLMLALALTDARVAWL